MAVFTATHYDQGRYRADVNKMDMIGQIDVLNGQFMMLQQRSKYEDLSDMHGDGDALIVRLRAAIERLAPVGSAYRKEMQALADDRGNGMGTLLRGYQGS